MTYAVEICVFVSLGRGFPLFQLTLKRGHFIDSLFTLSGKWLLYPSALGVAFSFQCLS